MDANRFDTLTRSLTQIGSRRRALVAALGGALSLLGVADATAHDPLKKCKKKSGKQKKTCIKKAKAHNTQHASETSAAPPPPSSPVCSPACGICQQCVDGTCVTAPDFTLCGRCKECFAGACEPVPDGRSCGTCLKCKAGACNNQECPVCEDCRNNVCGPRQCSPPHLCQTNCQCNPTTNRCACEPVICLPGQCQGNCACDERLGCMCDFQC